MKLTEFDQWVEQSQPGDILCYWEGWLAVDRRELKELDALASEAHTFAEQGLVRLTQDVKHHGDPGDEDPVFVYIAERTNKDVRVGTGKRACPPYFKIDKAALMAGSAYGLRNRLTPL
jgi:hypothetical protein